MDLNKDLKDIHININSSTFNILYRKYKSFVLPMSIIIASLILFFIILIPQVKSVLDARDQESIEKQKLERLQNNLNILNSFDQGSLNTNLDTAALALPSTKDFAGIISSISDKSQQAGVSIGDFSFSVGDLSTIPLLSSSFPALQISLSITGSTQSLISFVKLLYKSLPIAEVTSVSSFQNSATITIKFYYKSYPQGAISDESQVTQFSPKDLALIDQLATWKVDLSNSFIPTNVNTESIDNTASPSAGGKITAPSPF